MKKPRTVKRCASIFIQATALAQTEPKPTPGGVDGSGFNFEKPKLLKAEPKPGFVGQAGPAQHYP